MTKVFEFSGHSDDVVAVSGEGAESLDNVYPPLNGKSELMCYFVVSERREAKRKLIVNALYDGCWYFGVSLFDEDVETFPFSAEFVPMGANAYTMSLKLTVPDSAHIECFKPDGYKLDNGISDE
jgi:hypothetical protein